MNPRVLSANRLADGAVVYFRSDEVWSTAFADAFVAHGDAQAERLSAIGRAAERSAQVVGAYLVDVVADGGGVTPATLRERIRAAGPTVVAA